ncbi:MAG: SAM-dependent methyltransferase [Thermoleophilia bacterium]|nr:SAM-dependent methyltransferase [Thermoleophilia bacterium]
MEIALTHPTLGYYSRVDRLLSHRGDFSTAPALSPFFNTTVARLVTELVDASLAATGAEAPAPAPADRPCVVELGGGEGHLAQAILLHWREVRPELRGLLDYRIVEVGAGLRQKQAAALSGPASAGRRVGWGADLEEACAGVRPVVIFGNEFLDALPVHLVDVRGTALHELYVAVEGAGLVEVWGDASDSATSEVASLFGTLDPRRLEAFTDDGMLEVSPAVGDLLRRVAEAMPSGSFVNIDYGDRFPGLPGSDRLSGPEPRTRRRRTVRGYFKHQRTADVLARAGRQDLTADVDFAALDLHGRRVGFEAVLFTTLAGFLRGGGAEDELRALREGRGEAALDTLEADRQATVLEHLLDEQNLGGAFKVMVQVKE